MSFPTKQLYLTNPSPKPTESPLKNSHTQNPYTPSMHPPNIYHPHPRTSTKPNQPYHIISNEPVTIPPRANTMNHPLCPSAFQKLLIRTVWTAFVGQPVHYTPVIINAENDNLPVHFINDSDQEIVIPKHSYVENMEPVNLRNLLMNTYYLNAFSKVTFCPTNVNACITSFRKTLVSSDPVLLILPVLPFSNTILILAMLNPSNRVYCTSHHYFKKFKSR